MIIEDSDIENKIGYQFSDRDLLDRALTRLAYSYENDLSEDYHMDAFATIGDAVIDLVVLNSLMKKGINSKGELSVAKTDIVNMIQLRRRAESIDLQSYVKWGKGESAQHIWTSGRVMAECFEALAGAAYLDGGVDTVEKILRKTELI